MPALIVEHCNAILAPGDTALSLKGMSHAGDPDLLGEGFGNLLLSIGFTGKITEFHLGSYVAYDLYWFTWKGVSIP